jgi:penicillin-binding protein 1C
MEQVNRPEGDEAWKFYDSSLKIALENGDKFSGIVMCDRHLMRYVVGVWW